MRKTMSRIGSALLAAASGIMLFSTGSCDVGLDGLTVYVAGDPYCCDDGYFDFGGSYYYEEGPYYEEEYYYEEGYYEEGFYP